MVRKSLISFVVVGVLTSCLGAGATNALAAVTLGAPNPTLGAGNANLCEGSDPDSCTYYNDELGAGETLTAPFTGVIVLWRVQFGTKNNGGARLKVLRKNPDGSLTTLRSSGLQEDNSNFQVFPAAVPISAGEIVGVNLEDVNGTIPQTPGIAKISSTGAGRRFIQPALLDGQTIFPPFGVANQEWAYNAVVEPDNDCDGLGDESQDASIGACPTSQGSGAGAGAGGTTGAGTPPSNSFSTGKLRRNKRKGTATLSVTVPSEGELTTGGKDVSPLKIVNKGTVKITIRAKGKAKKKLRRKGSVKLNVKITFKPTGGVANTQTKTVKLIKRS